MFLDLGMYRLRNCSDPHWEKNLLKLAKSDLAKIYGNTVTLDYIN